MSAVGKEFVLWRGCPLGEGELRGRAGMQTSKHQRSVITTATKSVVICKILILPEI